MVDQKKIKLKFKEFNFHDITDYEREMFKERFSDELKHIQEIKRLLDESIADLEASKRVFTQRERAYKLEEQIKTKIAQVELDRHLKVFSMNLRQMKVLHSRLKKRIISKIDQATLRKNLLNLEQKIEDQIYREECGLNEGFKSIPMTSQELNILLKTIAA